MFWIFCEGIASLIENWIIYDFYKKFHQYKYLGLKSNLFYCFFILITTIFSAIIGLYTAYSGIFTLICIGLVMLFGIAFLKGSIFTKFLIPIIAFCLIFVINIMVDILLAFILQRDAQSLYVQQDFFRLLCLIVTKFLFYFSTRIILFLFKKVINLNKYEWILLSVILLLSLCIGIFIVEIAMDHGDTLSFPYVMAFCAIILLNFSVFGIIFRMSRQNEKNRRVALLELQVSQQKQAIEHMDLMSNKIKQTNHDHLNHLLMLQEMLNEEKYKEAGTYLSKLVNINPHTSTSHIQVSDDYLRAVLTVKVEQCQKKKIPLYIRADDAVPTCDSIDLCILLSNLLDNAVEASERIKKPKIVLNLSQQKNYYKIVLKNRIEESVLEKNAELKTTKHNHDFHGIGIQNVREIVDRYYGMIEYYESNNYFFVQVWLQQSIPKQ